MNQTYQKRVLLADNSEDYRRSLKGLLELENYAVEIAASVKEAKDLLDTGDFDLVLIDLRLTDDDASYDVSGFEVAKTAAKLSVPCIFISAFATMDYQRFALQSREAGPLALDFIEKKYGPQAVLDALRIVFSRPVTAPILESPPDLSIDIEHGLVRIKGEVLDLPPYQYALLAYLYQKQGAVATPQELIKAIYDEDLTPKDASTDRRLERLVDRLREKIEKDPPNPQFLVKVYARGYRLAIDN
ncbi:MAG TPA: response regulator transcription factor [Anaerolineales bacterium]|nr:response regulator transcription factor [Anaerolineales bacterium]HLO31841.1 response regulator transcription factor [Anaerolineales bacterium]